MDLRDLVDCGFKVLLVGEGDFSFAVSLLQDETMDYSLLFATTFDSRETCVEKYKEDCERNIKILQNKQVNVLFEVDGTDLVQCKELNNQVFDVIWFNFPHVSGGNSHKHVEENRKLLRLFFRSSRQFLHPKKGRVCITLRDTEFYKGFRILSQSHAESFELCQCSSFSASRYPGYKSRRTIPSKDPNQGAPSNSGALLYEFRAAAPLSGKRSLDSTVKTVKDFQQPCLECGTPVFSSRKERNRHFNSAKHAQNTKKRKVN